jgi:DNA-binding GntR family transcriptional regulator
MTVMSTETPVTPVPLEERSSLTLTHKVSDSLRSEIIGGVRLAGDRLNEVAIAQSLNVSRGPVREAILRLENEGLVVISPHRGAFVKTIDPQGVLDLFELRLALECEAAALAAVRVTGEDLVKLRSLQRQSSQLVNAKNDGFSNDVDLHNFIGTLSMNTALAESVKNVNMELRLARLKSGSNSQRASEAVAEHNEIIKMISVRDAEGARAAMRDHLLRSLGNTLELMYPDSEPSRRAVD